MILHWTATDMMFPEKFVDKPMKFHFLKKLQDKRHLGRRVVNINLQDNVVFDLAKMVNEAEWVIGGIGSGRRGDVKIL